MPTQISLPVFREKSFVDLRSTRRGAAVFLDGLLAIECCTSEQAQNWAALWAKIGDDHCFQAKRDMGKARVDKASDSWLSALTAFEVASRLLDSNNPTRQQLVSKASVCAHLLGRWSTRPLQPVRIECWDNQTLTAYFLPANNASSSSPSVIYITDAEKARDVLVGRMLPAVAGRNFSILIVSSPDISGFRGCKSEEVLERCLSYLIGRPDVDGGRIAVFGERFGAVHATTLAVADRRVVAAVCDAGVWMAARMQGAVDWFVGTKGSADRIGSTDHRLRTARSFKCPILVIAGELGIVGQSEAIELHSDCKAAGIHLDVAVQRTIACATVPIENFVSIDDFAFC